MNAHTLITGPILAALVALGGSGRVLAQARPQPMRGDVSGTVGWLAAEAVPPLPLGHDEWGSSTFAAGTVGWYWNNHLKSEAEFGAGTEALAWGGGQVFVDGRASFQNVQSAFSRRTAALTQQYQFFRNAWFHPYLGAGLNLTWERRTDQFGPVTVWDGGPNGPTLLEPGRTEGPRTETMVHPVVAAGFKAYFNQRVFFRSDLRVTFDSRADSTLLRAGFGVDF